jgi:hypothetical protein
MEEGLGQAKRRVRARVLGMDGIHAVGIDRANGRVLIYATPGALDDQLLRLAEVAASPHPVEVVAEEPAIATRSSAGKQLRR